MRNIPSLCITVLGGVFVIAFWMMHGVKVFWLDEIFTHYQVSGHSLGSLFESCGTGVNNLPPGYFLLLHLQGIVLGDGPLALRFPSLACTLISLFFAYRFLRLFFDGFASAIAVVTVYTFSAEILVQMTEARPYAAYFMLSVASAYYGTLLVRESSPGWKLLGVNALLAFLLPFTHYYGGLYNALFLAAVLLGDVRSQRLRPRVYLSYVAGWAAFCVAGLGTFLSQMAVVSGKAAAGQVITANHFALLFDLYGQFILFPLPFVLLVCAHAFLERGVQSPQAQPQGSSILLVMAFWLLVPSGLVAASMAGILEVPAQVKYFLPTTVPLLFLIGWFTSRIMPVVPDVDGLRLRKYLFTYVIVCFLFLGMNVLRFQKALAMTDPGKELAPALGGGLPLFVHNNTQFYHLSYFSKNSPVYRITGDATFVAHNTKFSPKLKSFNYRDSMLDVDELLVLTTQVLNVDVAEFLEFLAATYDQVSTQSLPRGRLLKFSKKSE